MKSETPGGAQRRSASLVTVSVVLGLALVGALAISASASRRTIGGVLLLALISNLLIMRNVSESYQELFTVAIILAAVGTFRQERRPT